MFLIQACLGGSGLESNRRPEEGTATATKGQALQFFNEKFDVDDLEEEELPPVRPNADTLRRLTTTELMPPPSEKIQKLDFEYDPDLPDFVTEQNIEFLVMARNARNPDDPWTFPKLEVLQQLFDKVRTTLVEHPQIMDVALWIRVEKPKGVATMMLSTVNLPLMNLVRHHIRLCRDFDGLAFETYNKRQFVKRFGISMYVTKENAAIPFKRLIRNLMYRLSLIHI